MSVSFAKRSSLALAATVALSSAVVAVPAAPSLAATAVVSHTTVASTAPAGTAKTQWSWDNGTALIAKNVTPTRLSASSYYLRVERNQGGFAELLGVLPNGHGVGLDGAGHLREYTKSGPKAYAKGGGPTLCTAVVRGSVVYGTTTGGDLYRLTGASAKAVKLGKVDSALGDPLVVAGSRIYWTRLVSAGAGKERYEVVSRPESGGSLRVEAKNARGAQFTDAGILVVRTAGAFAEEDYAKGFATTGIGVLRKGGVKSFLKFNGKGLASQIGDGPWNFTASGHTLTLPAAGTSGQVVINLKNRKAWRVATPQGTVPSWAGVSGSQAVWDVRSAEGEVKRNAVYLFNVDSGRAFTLTTRLGGYGYPKVNGKAIGWTYDRADDLVEYKSIVLK